MKTKPFDPSLHDRYDSPGRQVVKEYITNRLCLTAQDNPDIYGVDLIIYKENKIVGYAEVEVRNNWSSDTFPYDTLNVPYRKKKLLENDKPTFFFSVNKPQTRMFCCTAEIVLNSNVEENRNKYVKSDEYFYKIPVNKLKLIEIHSKPQVVTESPLEPCQAYTN
jgi:hypothetical protein